MLKDSEYFFHYTKQFLALILALALIGSVFLFLSSSLLNKDFFNSMFYLINSMDLMPLLYKVIIISVSLISLLFFLDSAGSFSLLVPSIIRSFKAIVWYLPVFLFLGVISLVFDFVFYLHNLTLFFSSNFFLNLAVSSAFIFLLLILKLFIFSIFVNFYIKIKHSNFSLFYS